MCSICRNKKCIYQFGKSSWPSPDDGLVTYQLPDSDLTMLESVRIAEDQLKKQLNKVLSLPEKTK